MKQHVGCFDVNVCMTISTEKYWNILNPHSITIMVGFLRFCCLNSILIQFLGPPPLGFCKIWISKIHSGLYNWNIMSTHICMITINVTNVLLISYHTHTHIYIYISHMEFKSDITDTWTIIINIPKTSFPYSHIGIPWYYI